MHTLPLLNCTPKENLRDGQLVVYEGMLQDMLNPQIYMESCEFKDATTGNVYFKSGLYRNSIECLVSSGIVSVLLLLNLLSDIIRVMDIYNGSGIQNLL